MGGCYPFDRLLAAYKVFKRFYGLRGDVAHVQIVVSILAFGVWAYDKAVEDTPLPCFINDAVSCLPVHFSIPTKKGSTYPFSVSVAAVLVVTDGGFCPVSLPCPPLDIIGLHYCH